MSVKLSYVLVDSSVNEIVDINIQHSDMTSDTTTVTLSPVEGYE